MIASAGGYRTADANEVVADVAYQASEVIAIYPITPASPMGEWADSWASQNRPNAWGSTPSVVEMQSEGGAAGALHGSLMTGAMSTTFTASQGLLLMIPNMYKIAGELTPTVIHVAARSVAAQALSIFADHSDVMAVRATGFALLASSSVQEAMDMAVIAHASTLASRIPFLHFFDGFRTSHEISKVQSLDPSILRAMIDERGISEFRSRGLTPDRPTLRGTAQNPDVFFQAREAVNPFYQSCPDITQEIMDRFAGLTGRQYRLFDYRGHPEAECVIVLMGSGAEAASDVVERLNAEGRKVGVVLPRLYRPFCIRAFLQALPRSVQRIGALDRTKEPGSTGEPLLLDVICALNEARGWPEFVDLAPVETVGGRYGLSSKEFTPGMIRSVFDELERDSPRRRFTVGIKDDVTHMSLDYDPDWSIEDPRGVRAMFYGLGADGTVGANKNSIKIIGARTENHAQGFFVYDSKKSGSMTVSHLRFGPRPIRAPYLIREASFVACHQFSLLQRVNPIEKLESGGRFLLNCPYSPGDVWDRLPSAVASAIVDKQIRFYVVNADRIAESVGLGRRISVVMQTLFFAISEILPIDDAVEAIRESVEKSFGKRGRAIVERNFLAIDQALEAVDGAFVNLESYTAKEEDGPHELPEAPEFVQRVTRPIMDGHGDDLPVSALPPDGVYPTDTAKYEKRGISREIPFWDADLCIQCGKCVLVCPHSVIRGKLVESEDLGSAPESFLTAPARWESGSSSGELKYTLQVAPEDCTGCRLCVEVCPVKSKSEARHKALNMGDVAPVREAAIANWDFFLGLDQAMAPADGSTQIKETQFEPPLFEFSGACAGCGETPYLKLLSQLFGDRALIANATGCSSIYGGNLPTTPWSQNKEGRGPAWANSLFEDNAEFGLGMRIALNHQEAHARALISEFRGKLGENLADSLLAAMEPSKSGFSERRQNIDLLKERLRGIDSDSARDLVAVADTLAPKSVWLVGGDGWAYDIGYGGLDHAIASGLNINILVLDTEVYSNTGGQMSKSTPRGAVAKFAAGGKKAPKKDLAMMAISYGNVYVARVAMGANDHHTVQAFREAESYEGPSLILAYSHCIAHGYDLSKGMAQQKLAVRSAYWPLLRFDPRRVERGEPGLSLDSKPPAIPLEKYIYNEARYTMLAQSSPEVAKELLAQAEQDTMDRYSFYKKLSEGTSPMGGDN